MHSRDLLRNNAWARKAQRTIANNVASWGIEPQPIGLDPKASTAAIAVWSAWAKSTSCDADGRRTFAGLQQLVMKTVVSDGEVFIRRLPRASTREDLKLPLQIQLLEADFIDQSKQAETSESGGPIVLGIEFDTLGRRAAYWFFPTHPGSTRTSVVSKRIPASEILHVFDIDRPGQVRGISWFAPVVVTLKDLDDYDDAELVKQKVAACFAVLVTDEGNAPAIGAQSNTDPAIETVEPGMISYLAPGKKVTPVNPPTLTSDSLPTRNLRRIAAGLGVTYEDLTGDYSQVNFSSARMARIAHWANVTDWRENLLIPQFCQGVWNWVMETAVLAGKLKEAPSSEWTSQPMPMIEPDKEGLATQRLVRTGMMTLSQIIREQGRDPKAHLEEYAADMKELDRLGIKLDSDPRAVSQAGLTQLRVGANGSEAESKDTSDDSRVARVRALRLIISQLGGQTT